MKTSHPVILQGSWVMKAVVVGVVVGRGRPYSPARGRGRGLLRGGGGAGKGRGGPHLILKRYICQRQ